MNTPVEGLLILGAGGELGHYIEALDLRAEAGRSLKILGILDDDPRLHGKEVFGHRVVGALSLACERTDARLIWGLGNPNRPAIRLEIAHRLRLAPERFISLVHPKACVSRYARIGPGVTILAGSHVAPDAVLAAHASLGLACVVEHQSRIGPGTLAATGVLVAGHVTIGAGSFLGQGASLRENIRVGNLAMVGMGSVVLGDVEDGQTVVGVPAKVIRSRAVPPEFHEWLEASLSPAERGAP
jgi:sugar O-acyltransferase (sialic acid O-acetyltransferase NeuD family)